MNKEKWNELYEVAIEDLLDTMDYDRPEAIRELDNILAQDPDYLYKVAIDWFSGAYAVC